MTMEYVKERKQFGMPVGAYQAVSHRCAQMLLDTEKARACWRRSRRGQPTPTPSAWPKAPRWPRPRRRRRGDEVTAARSRCMAASASRGRPTSTGCSSARRSSADLLGGAGLHRRRLAGIAADRSRRPGRDAHRRSEDRAGHRRGERHRAGDGPGARRGRGRAGARRPRRQGRRPRRRTSSAAQFVATDVSDLAANEAMVAFAVDRCGGVDYAFLNAGVTSGCGVGEDFDLDALPPRDERQPRRRRVRRPRRAARRCAQRGGGAIVATASLAGLTGVALDPIYAANKHAVVGLTRSLGPALAVGGHPLQRRLPRLHRVGDDRADPRARSPVRRRDDRGADGRRSASSSC